MWIWRTTFNPLRHGLADRSADQLLKLVADRSADQLLKLVADRSADQLLGRLA